VKRRAAVLFAAALIGASARAQTPDLGTDAQRADGKVLYEKFCSQCHGDAGDGLGVAAEHLLPLPRNFTTGKFKVRTTPSGALPTTDDLKHIIRRGMPYTTMPAWPEFTDDQLAALAYYLKTFSPDFAKPDFNVAPVALPKAPAYSKEAADKGRKVYEDTGCIVCHGDLGRGDGASAPTLTDDWGHPIRPADFTQRWTFRGGPTRDDIFRTMTTGFNGTPMPAFGDALSPEERWAITDYMYSLGESDEPHYASLVSARHLDEPIDVTKGAAAFAGAPVARFPIVGQVTEPGREFHPPVVSVQVQAVYDADDVAFLLRWNDMSADRAGTNSPALPVAIADETAPAPAAAAAATDEWGEATEAAPAADAPAVATFSDAVAIQFPLQAPTGIRKPYYLFGDAANPVDLWFVDLAGGRAQQFVGKGSADVSPSDSTEVAATVSYDKGEWSVILKRSRTPSAGLAIQPGQFAPIAFSVWDGISRERGNRRGVTQWFSLYVEPERVVSPVVPMVKAGLGVLALELLVIALVRRQSKRP
jgi:DMSO reductase family type II enzyme heme b subunit